MHTLEESLRIRHRLNKRYQHSLLYPQREHRSFPQANNNLAVVPIVSVGYSNP